MTEPRSTFWFPVKAYGWGWGLPVKWQGWVVLILYFALLLSGISYLIAQGGSRSILIYAAILTAVLVIIIFVKGERPAKWRWGGK